MTATPAHADRYLAAWNETDPAARRAAVDELFAPGARYTDPAAAADGPEAIDVLIAAVQARFPGWTFRLAGPVDAHHDQLRFTWELGPHGQEAPVAGFDVVLLDADARITRVLGFLDRIPAPA